MVTRVVTAFTAESKDLQIPGAAVSLIYIPSASGRDINYEKTITEILSSVDTKLLGTNFLAIVSLKNAEVLMKVSKSLQMVNIINQWLYVMCDTNWVKGDISHLEKLLREGDNVAFIYNATIVDKRCTVSKACNRKRFKLQS